MSDFYNYEQPNDVGSYYPKDPADYDKEMERVVRNDIESRYNNVDTRVPGSIGDSQDTLRDAEINARDLNQVNMSIPGAVSDSQDALRDAEINARDLNQVNMSIPGAVSDSQDDLQYMEDIVKAKKEQEAPVYEQLNALVKNGIPDNSDTLKSFFKNINCREDYVHYLLEQEKNKFVQVNNQTKGLYDEESSQKFNNAAFEYLAVINSLADLKAEHLSNYDSFGNRKNDYDSYYVDLELEHLMEVAHQRQKNGANINIPIPKDYDFNNPQVEANLVNIIGCTEKTINNQKYINEMWKQIGYENKNKIELEDEKHKTL